MQPYPRNVATRLEGAISLPEHIWSGIRECSHQYCDRGCNSGYTFTNTEKIADETREEDFAVCIVWRGSTVSSSTAHAEERVHCTPIAHVVTGTKKRGPKTLT